MSECSIIKTTSGEIVKIKLSELECIINKCDKTPVESEILHAKIKLLKDILNISNDFRYYKLNEQIVVKRIIAFLEEEWNSRANPNSIYLTKDEYILDQKIELLYELLNYYI